MLLKKGNGAGNLKPNGVFMIRSGRAAIVESSERRPGDDVKLATQSGPPLVRNGDIHPAFNRNSPNRRSRSAIAVEPDGGQSCSCSRKSR